MTQPNEKYCSDYNEAEYFLEKYKKSGGDAYHNNDANHKLFMNPGKVDEGLWAKAKRASEHAFGQIKWPFVTYWYKEHGGTFK